MQFDSQQYPHGDLTEKIIGAAMAVHRSLGPGLDEKIYENALCLEFVAQSLDFSQQQQFPVFYRNKPVGNLITDLIVEGKVIIETKVASGISDAHIAQTLSYLSISGLQVGLILNFRTASLTFKRVANIYIKNQ
jgi:GxxExxY protein